MASLHIAAKVTYGKVQLVEEAYFTLVFNILLHCK